MNKYIYSLIYVLSTSLSIILIEKVGSILPPLLTLLISTVSATLYFHLINMKVLKKIYRSIYKEVKNWILTSLITAAIWVATFYGAKEAGAFVFIFIYFITAAITGSIVLLFNQRISQTQIISGIGLSLLLIIFTYLESPLSNIGLYHTGIILALIGGILSYFYRQLSFTITRDTHLTASQFLTVRSYGIILIGLLSIPSSHYVNFCNLCSWKCCSFLRFQHCKKLIRP